MLLSPEIWKFRTEFPKLESQNAFLKNSLKITLRLSGFRLVSFLLVVHLFHDNNFRNDLANTYIFSLHGISDNIQESVLS